MSTSRLGDRSWTRPPSGTTVGPWRVAGGSVVTDRFGHPAETVAVQILPEDARLVAMAPELLAVCASMYARMTTGSWAHLQFEDRTRWIEMLRSVLTDAGLQPPPQPDQPRAARAEQGELFV